MRQRSFTLMLLGLVLLTCGIARAQEQETKPRKRTVTQQTNWNGEVHTFVGEADSTKPYVDGYLDGDTTKPLRVYNGNSQVIFKLDKNRKKSTMFYQEKQVDKDDPDHDAREARRARGTGFDVVVHPGVLPPEHLQMLQELRLGLENDSPYVQVYKDLFDTYNSMQNMNEDLDFFHRFDKEEYQQFKEQPVLDKKSFELARSYRKAKTDQERKKIETELESTLQKLFDLREQRKELEIKRLQEDLKRTQEKFNERKMNRTSIIRKRLNEMLDKSDGLEW